jgi:diguanylate cyclase (GGDEF)-like protein/PAS domain S-box-containing protein
MPVLNSNDPRFREAIGASSVSIVLTDCTLPDNPVVFVNRAFADLTGYSPEESLGGNMRFLQGPGTDAAAAGEIREAVARGDSIRREILNYRKDGQPFWNEVAIDPIRDEAGHVTGFIGVQLDCTQRHEAEERFAGVVDNLPGYVFQRVLKPDGRIIFPYVSRSIFRILGLPEDADWSDGRVYEHLHPEDRERVRREVAQSTAELTPLCSVFRFVSATGQEHWFRSNSIPCKVPNGDVLWAGLAVDISAEKTSELRIAYLAGHDVLTGLPNRVQFRSFMIKAIAAAGPGAGRVVLFYLDLDDFEAINLTRGQSYGDRVLRRIGLRLTEFCEKCGGTAARIGGDEFALLIPALTDAASPLELAEAIRLELRRSMAIDGQEAAIDACVGVALLPEGPPISENDAEAASSDLMTRAHFALQAAKQDGSGICRLYAVEFDDRFRNRAVLRRSLLQAVEEKQFELHYQPVVELASGRIVGGEALIRWIHPELGPQRPDLFIPLAESSGLIVPIGAWVIEQAMRQAGRWRSLGLGPTKLAINVSSIQFQRPGFVAAIERILKDTGSDPRDFDFELTEGTVIEASAEIHEQLHALRSLGFGLVIDDFGTGHSTFKYLRQFPVDKIKIDQSFVRQLVIGSSDASIIRAMIALAQSLNIGVVAEGIETPIQRDFLREEGCLVGQGYLFSMPMSAEDFGWVLSEHFTLPRLGPAAMRPTGTRA